MPIIIKIKKVQKKKIYICNVCSHKYRDSYILKRHYLTKKHINKLNSIIIGRPTLEELNKIRKFSRLQKLPTRKELALMSLSDCESKRDSFTI